MFCLIFSASQNTSDCWHSRYKKRLLIVIMSTQCVGLFIILDNKSMSNKLLHFGDISSSNVTPSNFTYVNV